MEHFETVESESRVKLWNQGHVCTRSGKYQLAQIIILLTTLIFSGIAESNSTTNSGIKLHTNAVGVMLISAVSLFYSLILFTASMFNLPNVLVIFATKKSTFDRITEKQIPIGLATLILGNLFFTSQSTLTSMTAAMAFSYLSALSYLLQARMCHDQAYTKESDKAAALEGYPNGYDSDASSTWNEEPNFRVTLNSVTRGETVVRTLSASSEECASFDVVPGMANNEATE